MSYRDRHYIVMKLLLTENDATDTHTELMITHLT